MCEEISENCPYIIDEARGLIPAHPNCRCVYSPLKEPQSIYTTFGLRLPNTDAGPADEPRDKEGRWTKGNAVILELKKAVPQLNYFLHKGPKGGTPHNWITASTEAHTYTAKGKLKQSPITIPGHETATG